MIINEKQHFNDPIVGHEYERRIELNFAFVASTFPMGSDKCTIVFKKFSLTIVYY